MAVLEFVVHVAAARTKFDLSLFRVKLPADLRIGDVELQSLPREWRTPGMSSLLQPIGDVWLDAGKTAVLCLPSVVVPLEHNFALNPDHPDFGRIEVGGAETFELDRRLAN